MEQLVRFISFIYLYLWLLIYFCFSSTNSYFRGQYHLIDKANHNTINPECPEFPPLSLFLTSYRLPLHLQNYVNFEEFYEILNTHDQVNKLKTFWNYGKTPLK